jgi:hypothetical protein
MRTLLTALAAATILIVSSAVGKAEAAIVTGVGSLPLTNGYSPVEKARRCVCGSYGCACGRRYRRGYQYDHYGYPRPGCTFTIREYQRRWPYQLWPPSMRCFPYPN